MRQIALAVQRHLVEQLHVFRGQLARQRFDALGIAAAVVAQLRQHLGHSDPVQQGLHFLEAGLEVRRVFSHVRHGFQQGRRLPCGQGVEQLVDKAHVHRAQHAAHAGLGDAAGTEGDGLVGEAEGVTHAAVRGAAEQPQGWLLEADHLCLQHLSQMAGDLLRHHVFQVELQAARQHRGRQFLRVRGREQEFHMRWRLFQSFQQRVETAVGQHVHLVDQVHLVARAGGRVLHVLQQVAGVLDLGAGGGVDFQQVHAAALGDFGAGAAGAAGFGADAGFTVEAFGENPRDSGLADAAGAGKQVGMVQAVVVQGVDERLQHVFLADHFTETARAPLAGENLIRHENRALRKSLEDTPTRKRGQVHFWGKATRAATPRHTHQ